MAPYNPPQSAHYSEVNISHISDENIKNFIGKGGYNFYKLTTALSLKYLWWDVERKVIEVWGNESTCVSGSKRLLHILEKKYGKKEVMRKVE